MNDLTLSGKFALISLNGVQVTETPGIGPLRERCLAAARFFEFILDDKMVKINNRYCFIYDAPETFDENGKFVYGMLKEKGINGHTISEWVDFLAGVPQEPCARWADQFTAGLVEDGLVDVIPSLLALDLNHRVSGTGLKQYRASYSEYHRLLQQIREEIRDNETVSDETVFLLWLLKQSGDLRNVISPEAAGRAGEFGPGQNLSGATMGISQVGEKEKRGFLSKRTALHKSDSIFIETNKMFVNADERIADAKALLESKGHICEIKKTGQIAVAEIDNILYELIPDAVRVKVLNVHGVRLRRYME
ncbi:hypothetical protein AALB39_16680 [Lachnospiraceae bacterium 54-53]